MQNAMIVLGAILGIFLGGWLALYLFHQSGDVGGAMTALTGAMPGTIIGGWIGMKLSARES